jgi:uncharacterized membrane protein
MKHLKHLLKQALNNLPNKVTIFLLVVALLGFIDATYLTVEHYKEVIPPCSVTGGCEVVLTSSYSTLLGIPVSLLGSIYYLLILVGVFTYFESKNTKLLKWAMLLTLPGFLFSLWFVYVQVFLLHAYCVYCLGSFVTSTLLFVASIEVFAKYQNKIDETIQYTNY